MHRAVGCRSRMPAQTQRGRDSGPSEAGWLPATPEPKCQGIPHTVNSTVALIFHSGMAQSSHSYARKTYGLPELESELMSEVLVPI